MLDNLVHSEIGSAAMQRARGVAAVELRLRSGVTRLSGLRQVGSSKAMLPQGPGHPEVVFLNTAGGVTGGDLFDYALTLEPGAQATATTQTAERAYASVGAQPGQVAVRLKLGQGARLDWLPQETILFEDSNLERHTSADLAGDSTLLLCEALILGRAAMGETVTRAQLFDRREIRRDGHPVWIDPVTLDASALTTGPAGLDGARAVATVALIAPGAEDAVGPLRDVVCGQPVEAGVSGWDGRVVVRMRATDGWPLRRTLAAVLTHLRSNALPRVWQL